jgi:hypothetical protein
MRLVAAIEDPDVARKILACLDLPARAPPLQSARVESDGHESESWDDNPPWTFDQRRLDDDDMA